MKDGIKQIVGKRISGVIVKSSMSVPRTQVFLIFDDDTHFELYSDGNISGLSQVDVGGKDRVRPYMAPAHSIILEFHEGDKL